VATAVVAVVVGIVMVRYCTYLNSVKLDRPMNIEVQVGTILDLDATSLKDYVSDEDMSVVVWMTQISGQYCVLVGDNLGKAPHCGSSSDTYMLDCVVAVLDMSVVLMTLIDWDG
jgi:hypothetical protein